MLRNQFNFSERGAQTAAYPPRERGTNTEPLPVTTVGGSCTQWVLYDAYAADQERQRTQAGALTAGRVWQFTTFVLGGSPSSFFDVSPAADCGRTCRRPAPLQHNVQQSVHHSRAAWPRSP